MISISKVLNLPCAIYLIGHSIVKVPIKKNNIFFLVAVFSQFLSDIFLSPF